ncbi:hypothetical protein CAOG_09146 [Capsaspora owczarzaki ATCC 30864]|uniref:Uncharacterized protein n=1 Tax=Capsaspora owczarzaki (strain ATCC 30864) TaxID=595528 RepID=A0A0D2X5J4_CAPO3|nr:hypothetical protein CAOG_09146 [Capsaspora owczarzaki ATCC 30864]KJE97914.1 hypothetical protein CAOG_009146 [Capsaspora owczarzaki ATCC 30864]|eukprot:XP_011270859.1 hypothetical protein CAOG_09146 [Capsaspora owczarzaki ATCC 30864]
MFFCLFDRLVSCSSFLATYGALRILHHLTGLRLEYLFSYFYTVPAVKDVANRQGLLAAILLSFLAFALDIILYLVAPVRWLLALASSIIWSCAACDFGNVASARFATSIWPFSSKPARLSPAPSISQPLATIPLIPIVFVWAVAVAQEFLVRDFESATVFCRVFASHSVGAPVVFACLSLYHVLSLVWGRREQRRIAMHDAGLRALLATACVRPDDSQISPLALPLLSEAMDASIDDLIAAETAGQPSSAPLPLAAAAAAAAHSETTLALATDRASSPASQPRFDPRLAGITTSENGNLVLAFQMNPIKPGHEAKATSVHADLSTQDLAFLNSTPAGRSIAASLRVAASAATTSTGSQHSPPSLAAPASQAASSGKHASNGVNSSSPAPTAQTSSSRKKSKQQLRDAASSSSGSSTHNNIPSHESESDTSNHPPPDSSSRRDSVDLSGASGSSQQQQQQQQQSQQHNASQTPITTIVDPSIDATMRLLKEEQTVRMKVEKSMAKLDREVARLRLVETALRSDLSKQRQSVTAMEADNEQLKERVTELKQSKQRVLEAKAALERQTASDRHVIEDQQRHLTQLRAQVEEVRSKSQQEAGTAQDTFANELAELTAKAAAAEAARARAEKELNVVRNKFRRLEDEARKSKEESDQWKQDAADARSEQSMLLAGHESVTALVETLQVLQEEKRTLETTLSYETRFKMELMHELSKARREVEAIKAGRFM